MECFICHEIILENQEWKDMLGIQVHNSCDVSIEELRSIENEYKTKGEYNQDIKK